MPLLVIFYLCNDIEMPSQEATRLQIVKHFFNFPAASPVLNLTA
jgi:hypothetical protein